MSISEQEYSQEVRERAAIDSRINAALYASEVLKNEGPSPNLPETFPTTVLAMAFASLRRMQVRQDKYDLDPSPVERSIKKLHDASQQIYRPDSSET